MDSIAAGVLMTWECCKTNENPNPDISKNADKNFPKSTTYVEVSLIKSSLDHLLQKTIGRCATSSINAIQVVKISQFRGSNSTHQI